MSRLMTKPTKRHVRPAKTQISLGIRPVIRVFTVRMPSLIRVFAVSMKKAWVLSYPLSAQQRLWSDWADAEADLSLRWAHTHFVGFVMRWLNDLHHWLTIFNSRPHSIALFFSFKQHCILHQCKRVSNIKPRRYPIWCPVIWYKYNLFQRVQLLQTKGIHKTISPISYCCIFT